MYFGYIKNVWSNNFTHVKESLKKLGVTFLVNEEARIIFSFKEEALVDILPVLRKSAKVGAWHDLVNKDSVYVIFGDGTETQIPFSADPTNPYWIKMKELEPSIASHKTIMEMINDSVYINYL